MDKQRGSITIIIAGIVLLLVVIGASYYFLSPMLLNKPVSTPAVVVNQNTQPVPTKAVTPTPVSTDSSQLVPPINNQADLDKTSTNLDDTTFTGVDSDMSQLDSDAALF